MIIENVDWQITSRCNRNCSYCFGPPKMDEMCFCEINKVLDKLQKHGTKQIGLTGGEPLLHPQFESIVKSIREHNMSIYLSTNGDIYKCYSQIIKEHVSIIGVPLDGPNESIHDLLRGHSSFSHIISLLDDISECNRNIKVKIGTVVTSLNFNYLNQIEEIVSYYEKIVLFWKLYELIQYTKNYEQTAHMKAPDLYSEYTTIGKKIDKNRIIIDTTDVRTNSYFFIRPNGDVFVPILNNDISYEKVIGNVKAESLDSIINEFNKLVNIKGYFEKYRYMKNLTGV